ncbi:MAG TPA: cupin domain-containing protein, partial [Polyangiales bacterium]
PFCVELARAFALPADGMRELLARIADPRAWTRGIAPIEAFLDFVPGPTLAPLRAGFVRLGGGAWLPRHRHRERELTFVLAGEMIDGDGRRYGPGSSIDMPPGSVHAIGVPQGKSALVALLHGGIEMT